MSDDDSLGDLPSSDPVSSVDAEEMNKMLSVCII